ncbi:ABC transporter permease [Lysinibacillus yapensis]|uniref:ABC transporter permease n=1 Tax=Ureibacillus yapensis TaxID=2304605 RepID=A0A396S774_9BACL|nr:ABC transporter permease [Lysinibacillus yapensis]RHW36705.1 ABC transporter permease [Lysinibacillus yapensis]
MKATLEKADPVQSKSGFIRKIFKKEALLSIALLVLLLAAWEILSRIGVLHPLILPAPTVVFSATLELLASSFLYLHLGVTLYETIAGFFIGSFLAIILGIVVSSNPTLYKVLNPFIVVFQAIPKIALAPIFVTWFGFGPTAKIVMAITICFFPTFVNTVVGLKSVDEESRLLFQSLVAKKKDTFFKLSLPTALPFIFAGLKSSLTFALIGAIVGEFVGANEGIGMLLDTFNFQLEMGKVYALIVILSIIALLLYLLIEWLDKKLIFWADRDNNN